SVDEGSQLSFTVSASDPDSGQSLTFSLDPGTPSGAAIDPATGVFTWTPAENQGPDSYNLIVRVTDNGSPNSSALISTWIDVAEVNRPPVLAAISDQSIVEGQDFILGVTASDPDLPA